MIAGHAARVARWNAQQAAVKSEAERPAREADAAWAAAEAAWEVSMHQDTLDRMRGVFAASVRHGVEIATK